MKMYPFQNVLMDLVYRATRMRLCGFPLLSLAQKNFPMCTISCHSENLKLI